MDYTKGEWKVSSKAFGGGDAGGEIVIHSPQGLVAMACTIHEGLINAETNARLIAAAPNLYEACKEWLDLWLYLREHYPDIELPDTLRGGSDACGRLRLAIAKAEETN